MLGYTWNAIEYCSMKSYNPNFFLFCFRKIIIMNNAFPFDSCKALCHSFLNTITKSIYGPLSIYLSLYSPFDFIYQLINIQFTNKKTNFHQCSDLQFIMIRILSIRVLSTFAVNGKLQITTKIGYPTFFL